MKTKKDNLEAVGTENLKVPDCPFYVPKQNIKFFKAMQDVANKNVLSSSSLDKSDIKKK